MLKITKTEINNWIPTSEKLPELYQDVLYVVKGYSFNTITKEKLPLSDRVLYGMFGKNGTPHFFCNIRRMALDDRNNMIYTPDERVTHWLPVPEPPK